MAGLVFACIAPHGSEVIAELAGEMAPRTAATRRAMEELGRRMLDTRPENGSGAYSTWRAGERRAVRDDY